MRPDRVTLTGAWHASRETIEQFKPFAHFGSLAQARMRAHRGDTLHEVEFELKQPKTAKDIGSWRRPELQRTKRAGFDGIVYLNRFEGISFEAFEAARNAGIEVDALSDSVFAKQFPEAAMSWIVFDPSNIIILKRIALRDLPPPE